MKTKENKIISILIFMLCSTLLLQGQTYPGGGYQGGTYGSGGAEDVTGIRDPVIILSASQFTTFPNPFSTQSTIKFTLDAPARVEISVFDLNNRQVRVLLNARDLPPGDFTLNWGGTDDNGNPLSSGIYYYRMIAGKRIISKKIIFLGTE